MLRPLAGAVPRDVIDHRPMVLDWSWVPRILLDWKANPYREVSRKSFCSLELPSGPGSPLIGPPQLVRVFLGGDGLTSEHVSEPSETVTTGVSW